MTKKMEMKMIERDDGKGDEKEDDLKGDNKKDEEKKGE